MKKVRSKTLDNTHKRHVKGAKQLAVVVHVRYGRGSTSSCGGAMKECDTCLCVVAPKVQEQNGEPLDSGLCTRDVRSFHMLTVVRNTRTGEL